jgi:hypothetical protein
MIPKRSWATLVPESIYESLRDAPSAETIELPLIGWEGDSPFVGDTLYLIKPKTADKFKDAGVFCATTIKSQVPGRTALLISNGDMLARKKSSYFRFESLNLKDRYLRGLSINVRLAGHAYFLDAATSVRLEILFSKTDETFSSLDAKISLLAYEESFIAGINPESSGYTVRAAIDSGRLVSSISSKMSNYKFLDDRAEGGLENGAKIDKTTWAKYYIPERRAVDTARLRQDIALEYKDYEYAFVVEEPTEPAAEASIPKDEERRQTYARRVRRGQSRFRMALQKLYGTRCAITGTPEETVLEACHIIPHAKTGDNSLDNGLLLRSDIHVLFDEHLLTLANDGQRILVHKDVTAPEYALLNGKSPGLRPSTPDSHLALIRLHNSELGWVI